MRIVTTQESVVNLLEALYAVEQPRAAWFRGAVKAASGVFRSDAGIGMLLYDIASRPLRIDAIDGVDITERNVELGSAVHAQPAYTAAIADCYSKTVCATFDEHIPDLEMRGDLRERYRMCGVADQVLVNGGDPSGLGAAVFAFSGSRIDVSPEQRTFMTWVAAHLSCSYRLSRRLGPSAAPTIAGGTEAVLTTQGRVEHAEPVARAAWARRDLSTAVALREQARGRIEGGVQAIAHWRPLVGARWSLVDRYEENGRRYVLAQENRPGSAARAALSSRECQVLSLAALGHSNKLIAYELGVAHSTVRVLLARAASKLGARTRSEAVEQLRFAPPGAAQLTPGGDSQSSAADDA